MGMFDKDKEIGRDLTATFKPNEEFILLDVSVQEGAVKTDYGMADKTTLTVRRIGENETAFEVTSLGGAIASKCKEAEPGDLPAIVCWLTVESKAYGKDATVLQFIRQP